MCVRGFFRSSSCSIWLHNHHVAATVDLRSDAAVLKRLGYQFEFLNAAEIERTLRLCRLEVLVALVLAFRSRTFAGTSVVLSDIISSIVDPPLLLPSPIVTHTMNITHHVALQFCHKTAYSVRRTRPAATNLRPEYSSWHTHLRGRSPREERPFESTFDDPSEG